MNVEIRREDYRSLPEYASVPIRFEIREVIDVAALESTSHQLPTRAVDPSRYKDYDAVPANDPLSWPTRFDIRSWIFLAAFEGRHRIGGSVVIVEPTAVSGLAGRSGSAILWDLRVAPALRGVGVGSTLLAAAEDTAHRAGCGSLDAETQDINVAACRLYAKSGYSLIDVIPDAYSDAPSETKLVWTKPVGEWSPR